MEGPLRTTQHQAEANDCILDTLEGRLRLALGYRPDHQIYPALGPLIALPEPLAKQPPVTRLPLLQKSPFQVEQVEQQLWG